MLFAGVLVFSLTSSSIMVKKRIFEATFEISLI